MKNPNFPLAKKAAISTTPKLSDRGARRGGCMERERRGLEAAAVTPGAVRCAWLDVVVLAACIALWMS